MGFLDTHFEIIYTLKLYIPKSLKNIINLKYKKRFFVKDVKILSFFFEITENQTKITTKVNCNIVRLKKEKDKH